MATLDSRQAHLYGSVKKQPLNDSPVAGAQVAVVKGNASLHCLTELLVLKLACSTDEGVLLRDRSHKATTATGGKEEGGCLLSPFARAAITYSTTC